jgi:microsomal dipeptidase-like Zn-dependent dipeptidase
MNAKTTRLAILAPIGAAALLCIAAAEPTGADQSAIEAPNHAAAAAAPTPATESSLFKKVLNTNPSNLRGFVDLHTHPMSHLAMGGKLLHGAPDTRMLMPAGAIYDSRGRGLSGPTCNNSARDAASVEEALGSCYSSHAGHDALQNKCGNHFRRLVINGFEDGKGTNKPHDVDHPPGYPSFTKWPKYNDVLHQQMWIDWIKRAHDGGMRVMVALSVNSMTFAKGLDGNEPYDDKTTGDLQVAQMKRLVGRHVTWMEIAYSAADLRRIVAQDKLAIILGSELDDIGNFAWARREPSRAEVKAEIARLYREGIRYIFPIHVIDNHFGGTAMYEPEFLRASKYQFGRWPSVICAAKADGITARFTNGWDLLKPFAIGEAGGSFPIPTCDSDLNGVTQASGPSRLGFKNARGLTALGRFALDEMMARGMLIDVDHGSQKTVDDIIAHTGARAGAYPLVSGHNTLRGDPASQDIHENTRTPAQYKAITGRKGVAGIGFGNSTALQFIGDVRRALAVAPGLPINLGSDINGFVVMPGPEPCKGAACVQYSEAFPRAQMGTKQWDYNLEGVAHIGLFPDFLRKVELLGGHDIVNKLFDGAEAVAVMWERAEKVGRQVTSSLPTAFDTIVVTTRTSNDDVRDGARAWVTVQLKSGDLPEVEISHLAKGTNTTRRVDIPVRRSIGPLEVLGVKVRHVSNECFACARDYWSGSLELEGKDGQQIMRTPDFTIGHETKEFTRR